MDYVGTYPWMALTPVAAVSATFWMEAHLFHFG